MRRTRGGRGASLVISLAVLSICVALGGIVMTYSSESAWYDINMAGRNQKYMTVSSAAQLLRDTFSGGIYDGAATLVRTQDKETGETYSVFSELGEGTYQGALRRWIEDSLNDIYYARSSDIWPVQEADLGMIPVGKQTVYLTGLTVNVETDAQTQLETVHWTLTIKNDYSIEAELWLEDEQYRTKLILPAEVAEEVSVTETGDEESDDEVTETTFHVHVTWPAEAAEFTRVQQRRETARSLLRQLRR